MQNHRILLIIFLFASSIFAQIETPQPSPFAKMSQMVGITELSIEYSRPGIKGREIFGGLVPFGEVWRTGANASTKFKFSSDVMLEGNKIPAGEYSLYTMPREREWKIIINNILDSGGNYKAEGDVVSFNVKPQIMPLAVERFTIEIADVTDNSAHIILKWAQTKVPIKLEVDTDALVMKSIAQFIEKDDPKDAGGWYNAARYYFENNKSKEEALDMVNRSLEIDDQPFWVLRLKSQLLAQTGDFEEAIIFAKKSMVNAQKAGNDQFVKMNEEAIAEWQGKTE
jgi:hypothetical protein